MSTFSVDSYLNNTQLPCNVLKEHIDGKLHRWQLPEERKTRKLGSVGSVPVGYQRTCFRHIFLSRLCGEFIFEHISVARISSNRMGETLLNFKSSGVLLKTRLTVFVFWADFFAMPVILAKANVESLKHPWNVEN